MNITVYDHAIVVEFPTDADLDWFAYQYQDVLDRYGYAMALANRRLYLIGRHASVDEIQNALRQYEESD